MSGFYLFVGSDDSSNLHDTNSFSDFVVELGRTYDLTQHCSWRETWNMALVEISLLNGSKRRNLPSDVIVTCDLVMPSYIYGTESCILRSIAANASNQQTASLHTSYYIGLKQLSFTRLRIGLRDHNLNPIDLKEGDWGVDPTTRCTIHFQRL